MFEAARDTMGKADLGEKYQRLKQMLWDPEPQHNETPDLPVWCLGRAYTQDGPGQSAQKASADGDAGTHSLVKDGQNAEEPTADTATPPVSGDSKSVQNGWPEAFLDDFEARIWLTYRSGFPPIARSSDSRAASLLTMTVRLRSQFLEQGAFTSDTGFGCMIRSGQCVLANALSVVRLGRSWRRGANPSEERRILSLFADDPRAPFSIHRFIDHGASACGKFPGEWFGPSATSHCIEALTSGQDHCGLRVYVTGNGPDVYRDDIVQLATRGSQSFGPVLILAGIRLGIDRVTPAYHEGLKTMLQLPQSIGIAGGRPSSSHYFIGVQGDYFFYLDPHFTRPKLPFCPDPNDLSETDVATCHTRRLQRLHVTQMDPSMLIAFLIQNRADWEDWQRRMDEAKGTRILHIADRAGPRSMSISGRDGAMDEVEAIDDESDAEQSHSLKADGSSIDR